MQSLGDPQGRMMKHPSTSTYGAALPGAGDSGVPSSQTYNSTNMSYEPDSDNASDGKFEVYRIDTLPDGTSAPVPAPRGTSSTYALPTSDENAAAVPEPVRSRTKDTKKKSTADPRYNNVSVDPNYQPQNSHRFEVFFARDCLLASDWLNAVRVDRLL